MKGIILKIIIYGITGFLVIWILYYFVQKRANKKMVESWYEEQFKPQSYKGIISFIIKYEIDPCALALNIKTADDEDLVQYVINCACDNELFVTFVSEGDSVIKVKGETKILFIKSNGNQAYFELPFCH